MPERLRYWLEVPIRLHLAESSELVSRQEFRHCNPNSNPTNQGQLRVLSTLGVANKDRHIIRQVWYSIDTQVSL